MTPPSPPVSFVVIVPVKPPARAKSRLDAVGSAQRRELAEAFARDTVAVVRRTPRVDAVLVVTDDHVLAGHLRADGCEVMPDGVSDDLNASLQQACAEVARRWPHAYPVALCADLPSLTSEDLTAALDEIGGQAAFVRDAAGTGTTLYAAPLATFDPSFGPGSAQAHVRDGVREVLAPIPSLRLDVDEPADLERALVLGVGPHTELAIGPQTH